MIAVFLDFVVSVLLVATLGYCIMLNRRLAGLRDDKGELRELIRGLATSSERADGAIAALRVSAEQVGGQLQQEVDRARELRDDLAYILERGNSLADRLEGAIRARRADSAGTEAPAAVPERQNRSDQIRADKIRRDPLPPAASPPSDPRQSAGERGRDRRDFDEADRFALGNQAPPRAEGERAGADRPPAERVTSFPSRVERDLRRVLESRK